MKKICFLYIVTMLIISSLVSGCGAQPETFIRSTVEHVAVPDVHDTMSAVLFNGDVVANDNTLEDVKDLFAGLPDGISFAGNSIGKDAAGRLIETKVIFRPKAKDSAGNIVPSFEVHVKRDDIIVEHVDTTKIVKRVPEKSDTWFKILIIAGTGIVLVLWVMYWRRK